ncbi:MAG: hypothetical protein SXQ77_10365 [Halobacteria archaeon]|nr:hypothetical protein [Halobacteria archaeon]
MSNQRRRYAFHYLKNHGESVRIGELAEGIAAWENDKDVGAITSDERKRVYISLIHLHLPKMADIGLIDFDKSRGRIEPRDEMAKLDVYLEIVPGNEIPWSKFYLGLAILNFGFILAAVAGLFPFTLLPEIAWGIIAASMFAISAIIDYHNTRKRRLGNSESPSEVCK